MEAVNFIINNNNIYFEGDLETCILLLTGKYLQHLLLHTFVHIHICPGVCMHGKQENTPFSLKYDKKAILYKKSCILKNKFAI